MVHFLKSTSNMCCLISCASNKLTHLYAHRVWQELKQLLDQGLDHNGVMLAIKIILTGDYAFLSEVLGLSGSNSTWPCIFCLILRAAYKAGGSQKVSLPQPEL